MRRRNNMSTFTKKYTFNFDQLFMQELSRLYGTQTEGVSRPADIWLQIRKRVSKKLQGYFSREELSCMVDTLNGTIIDSALTTNKVMLIASLNDGNEYENLYERWGVDGDKLIEKIEQMSIDEYAYLIDEIYRFWNIQEAYGSPSPNLEAFMIDWRAV
jgi:hypothetical protein